MVSYLETFFIFIPDPDSDKPKYTTDTYPPDLDTTSLGMIAFPPDEATAHSILDDMLDYVDEDGNIQVSLEKSPKSVPWQQS